MPTIQQQPALYWEAPDGRTARHKSDAALRESGKRAGNDAAPAGATDKGEQASSFKRTKANILGGIPLVPRFK